MGELLRKILDFSSKFGFLKSPGASKSFEHLNFGPMALLLANNIHNQWFLSNVINTNMNIFVYESHPDKHWSVDCQMSYSHLLQIVNEQWPFGLASIVTNINPVVKDAPAPPQSQGYRQLVFINPKDSQRYFYRLQQKRKIWWRKFSTDPERFNIVEDKRAENCETVHITATFPWTTETVETIRNHGDSPLAAYGPLFEFKVGRKKTVPHVIESLCMERAAVITYLCDAFQPLPARTMLRLHHALAPYHTALAVDTSGEKVEELGELATFLTLSLRKAGLHTLFPAGSGGRSKKALDTQLATHDSLGVPYTVVLTDSALTNGIIGLHSRDTTLQEQVHVSSLVAYMQKLLNK